MEAEEPPRRGGGVRRMSLSEGQQRLVISGVPGDRPGQRRRRPATPGARLGRGRSRTRRVRDREAVP